MAGTITWSDRKPENREKPVLLFCNSRPHRNLKEIYGNLFGRQNPQWQSTSFRLHFFLLLLFIYSHVHTFFGSFLPPASLSPLPPQVPGKSCSAFIISFVEEKRQA
jgi:hypothetical protein